MICPICKHGDTTHGVTTITLERGTSTLIFKQVPARICTNCGESYLDTTTTQHLLTLAEHAIQTGVQVEIRDYAPPHTIALA